MTFNQENWEHVDDVLHQNGINPLYVNVPELTDQLLEKFGVVDAMDLADEDIVAAAR